MGQNGPTDSVLAGILFVRFGVNLEEGLRAKYKAAIGAEVVALKVDLVSVPLHVHERQIRSADFIGPCGHDGIGFTSVFDHFLVSAQEKVLGECFRLHAGHVHETLRELLFEILFAGTRKGCHQAALGKWFGVLDEDFTNALAIDLKSCDMASSKDPAFEVHVVVRELAAAFNSEEFRMECLPVDQH